MARSKKKAPKGVARKRGPSRACSVCGALGHNKRSHKKGGKLNPYKTKARRA